MFQGMSCEMYPLGKVKINIVWYWDCAIEMLKIMEEFVFYRTIALMGYRTLK